MSTSHLHNRTLALNQVELKPGPVVYWMSRDQRSEDNWALIRVQEVAQSLHSHVVVVMALRPNLIDHAGTAQWLDFMMEGLKETEESLRDLYIPFTLLLGDPVQTVLAFASSINAGLIVTDFSPLAINATWRDSLSNQVAIRAETVDAHNIVPVWIVSPKQEFAARTFRPKLLRLLDSYLYPCPPLKKQNHPVSTRVDWQYVRNAIKVDESITNPGHFRSGKTAAWETLHTFIDETMNRYTLEKNDPTKSALSNLSPYLHFGQISPQRVALTIMNALQTTAIDQPILEELVVRRELADNYCYYQKKYDEFAGFPNWAQQTLDKQRSTPREFIYSEHEFETAVTHDQLWNAAQNELIKTGKMHGYMRMYWAKKILEWSPSPEEAQHIAISLNDRLSLDGRDPNGYTGIAWSIGGVHDRPWFNQPIFGSIRYMSSNGAKKKFSIEHYCQKWL